MPPMPSLRATRAASKDSVARAHTHFSRNEHSVQFIETAAVRSDGKPCARASLKAVINGALAALAPYRSLCMSKPAL